MTPLPFKCFLYAALDQIKELFYLPLELGAVGGKVYKGYAKLGNLLEGFGAVFAAHIGNKRTRELVAAPVLRLDRNAKLPAPSSFICNHVQQQAAETVQPAFPGQGIAAAQAAVDVDAGGQDRPPDQIAGIVYQVDIADRRVQETDPGGGGKFPHAFTGERAVVALVVGQTVSRNIEILPVSRFAVKVPELIKGWVLFSQRASFVAVLLL